MTEKKPHKPSKTTSWDNVAHWYDKLLAGDDTYQGRVILPNLLRAMAIKKGERVLELGCGQGFFTQAFYKEGARTTGVDLGRDLIAIARKQSPKEITYVAHSAEDLSNFGDKSFDKVALVLSLQNIDAPHKVFKECSRVLVDGGQMHIVLNHPAFRIPKSSSWGYDEVGKTQYRRIDKYMSESKVEIEMNPSKKGGAVTTSFHRPLQYYFKLLANNGFVVARLEEWLSHKESEQGPRKVAEDSARMEIPLFLLMEVRKLTQ